MNSSPTMTRSFMKTPARKKIDKYKGHVAIHSKERPYCLVFYRLITSSHVFYAENGDSVKYHTID